MEIEKLQRWGEELSKELAVGRSAGRSKKWRCAPELRSRIILYAKACRDLGQPYLDIAVRLGLVESTLTRWLRTEKIKDYPGFRSVSIVPSTGEDQTQADLSSRSLRLVTPHGYRVEGLDAETLAYILRALG